MKRIGIDIGTTTITILLVENDNIIDGLTYVNSFIENEEEKIQDPNNIYESVKTSLDSLISKYSNITSIGITGQMHGIVYINENNNPVSPLYTWCDLRASKMMEQDFNYCQFISKVTNYDIYPGYGMATHYYNLCNNLIPKNAKKILTIADYIALRLTKSVEVVTHISNAASFGLFDLKKFSFDDVAIEKLGIDLNILPKVINGITVLGKYKNIDVYVPIGDNQASFLGANCNIDSILINIGTGSQVSIETKEFVRIDGIETRPYLKNNYLLVGASICGGKSYQALAEFYQSCSYDTIDRIYEKMNNVDVNLISTNLEFETTFSGTRLNPEKKASIKNLSLSNFNFSNFTIALLKGIVKELYDYYDLFLIKKEKLVGSGNGIRKNRLLQYIIEKTFSIDLEIPNIKEEAAFGTTKLIELKEEK